MEGGSAPISKVTVEYADPSNLFPLVADTFRAHLPLRNLHWKSPTRPLRSIDFLHVELVPSAAGAVQDDRRHQIPGLRRTPYLKIYLLRCDDSDTYKASARKAVREWVRSLGPASASAGAARGGQENHDACEWLVLHVVMPGSLAAVQSSARKEGGEKSKGVLGRGGSSILEKLKADFNIGGKGAMDRVAQVRLDPSAVPDGEAFGNVDEEGGAKLREEAWQDVVAKMKALILASFNLRVSQYEEDIRERDAQRSLPGWNFCTFFVLKEGLARGFESAGLVEDALMGYDELSLGLDTAIRELSEEGGSRRSDSFLGSTEELKDLLIWGAKGEGDAALENLFARPISAKRKNYRQLVLSNNISIFDFKCYIFARQMAILLRMGIPHSDELASIQDEAARTQYILETEDLGPLSDLCARGSSFISSVSRLMRADLHTASRTYDVSASDTLIDNLVSSWTYAVAQQLLEETTTRTVSAVARRQPVDPSHPPRSSSLSQNLSKNESQAIFDRLAQAALASDSRMLSRDRASDLETLAGRRAELGLLQRRVLERVGQVRGWEVGFGRFEGAKEDGMEDVDLDEDAESQDGEEKSLAGVCQSDMIRATQSLGDLREVYEKLTNMVLDHVLATRSTKVVEMLTADLALIKYDSGDYVSAANYLSRVTPLYSSHQWSAIETVLLKVHAACLAKLHRKDDHVRALLALLAQIVARRRGNSSKGLRSGEAEGQQLLKEIVTCSKELPYELSIPAEKYFEYVEVEPYIKHRDDRDGFMLRVKVRQLLSGNLKVDAARVRLRSIPAGGREIWLDSAEAAVLKEGVNWVEVGTNVTTDGTFVVDKVMLKANKIAFVHEPTGLEKAALNLPGSHQTMTTPIKARILCYPAPEAFHVTAALSRHIFIDQPRTLEIACESGWNEIQKAEVHIRSATGGLRLRTASTVYVSGDGELKKISAPGVIEFSSLPLRSKLVFKVPYDLEDNIPDVSLKLDIKYTTPHGVFDYISSPTITNDLPLDVNVHDLFKSTLLYSRFNIRTSKPIPLDILSVSLTGTDRFAITAPPVAPTPLTVFPAQPATLMYQIRQIARAEGTPPRQPAADEKPLTLAVDYRVLEDVVLSSLSANFASPLFASPFHPLIGLLRRAFVDRVRQIYTPADYEEVALLSRVRVPPFADMAWESLVDVLPPSTAGPLRKYLEEWHKACLWVGLLPNHPDPRRVTIKVPLPRLRVLHTAVLDLPAPSGGVYTTGTLIPATLRIVQTRRWDVGPMPEKLEFVYEIEAPPGLWLVGGMRRGRFWAKEGECKEWAVPLVPLMAGRLPVPGVEVYDA
ncbi:hypothetical protein EJ06DRAFT_551146 [Trichodelitschia bisporula]|uniref:Trafficking protein particle complex subunit 10 n=1 Tax=Trichodelitschia bisporula TaxID=703511 RepID=A0A6G1HM47_9PEZI|nr:hypothetical protein EJ06DRAFT_551146 [Trichodelitschia bisporula]